MGGGVGGGVAGRVRVFMETVSWKDQEGFSRELECRMNLGASSRPRLPRVTENLKARAFPCWGIHLADPRPPDPAVLLEPSRDAGVLAYINLHIWSERGRFRSMQATQVRLA